MTQINVELLQQTMQYIDEHPEEWDQSEWAVKTSCGTSACFAGTAAVLSGYQLTFYREPGRGERVSTLHAVNTDNRRYSISGLAVKLLGLDEDDANELFAGSNILSDLHAKVDELIEKAKKEGQ